MKKTWPFLLLVVLISSCRPQEKPQIQSKVPFINNQTFYWADSLVQTLSLDEKIGQLLLWEYKDNRFDQLRMELNNLHLGGVVMRQRPLLQHFELVTLLSQESSFPPLIASTASTLFNNQLSGVENIVPESLINATANDTLFDHLNQLAAIQALALQVNLNISQPVNAHQISGDRLQSKRIQALNKRRIASVAFEFTDFHPQLADSSLRLQTLLQPAQVLTDKGIGGFVLSSQLPTRIPEQLSKDNYNAYLQKHINFDGLLLRKTANPEMAIRNLQSGVDVLWLTSDSPTAIHQRISKALETGELSRSELDQKVRKIFMLKKWMHNGFDSSHGPGQQQIYQPLKAASPPRPRQEIGLPIPSNKIYEHFFDTKWGLFNYDIAQRGLTLLSNPRHLIPVSDFSKSPIRLIHYGTTSFPDFQEKLAQYTDFSRQIGEIDAEGNWLPLNNGKNNYLNCLLLGPDQIISPKDQPFFESLVAANKTGQLVIINFGAPHQVASLDDNFTLLQAFTQSTVTEAIAAQIVAGGLPTRGINPMDINTFWESGQQEKTPKIRVSHAPPEFVGIRPEKLVSLNAIANAAIRGKATPGCQIAVIKDGNFIFHQSFGYHTYANKKSVRKDDLYDLASLTKISATTLVAMRLQEAGILDINDRIKKYLPEYNKAPFRNVKIKELMTHRSGIQPHMPVVPYLKYRGEDNAACDSFFCKTASDTFTIQIADQFYFQQRWQDQIWDDMNAVQMRRFDKFRYSDANLILLQRILERKQNQNLDQLAKRYFYRPLGLSNITYQPLKRFNKNRIVPTEDDEKWRRQLIHGYVHDETAALLGGIAGHAGLFSNASDLAILLQMLLQGGTYANTPYLKPETIELFTSSRHGNHRGLGFDKRHRSNRTGRAYDMTPSAYGHTGFTGTAAWVDPDHNLVFVFLSNRLHPSVQNRDLFSKRIRTRLHQVVYDALDSYQGGWPKLEI